MTDSKVKSRVSIGLFSSSLFVRSITQNPLRSFALGLVSLVKSMKSTVRRGSALGVRDRARRSLRARPERLPSELSESLSSDITMNSSMTMGTGRARAQAAGNASGGGSADFGSC